jgi:hypothetical protein
MSADSLMPILLGTGFLILLTVVAFVIVLSAIRRSRSRQQSEAERRRPVAAFDDHAPRSAAPDPGFKSGDPQFSGQPSSQLPFADPPNTPPSQAGEVMRVIRDPQTGETTVQIEGQEYGHIREIQDPETGRQVLAAIADLVRFTGGVAANSQAMRKILAQGAPATPPSPTPTADTSSRSRSFPSPVQDARLDPDTMVEQPLRQRPGVLGYLAQGFQPQEPPTPLPSPTAFVGEIEEILQGYIHSLPSPLSREVHVGSGPDGLLQIQVGLDKYSHPDDVPDPEVRRLIKAAVAEWEKR